MKRTIAYTTAAILASVSLAVPAYALDVGVGANAGAGASASGSGSGNSGGNGNAGGLNIGGGLDANTGAQVQTGGGSSNGSIDAGTTASTDSDSNFGLLISSMRSGDSATRIEGMTEVSSVSVVNVEDLAQGNNLQAFENAKNDNEAQIGDLQAAVAANADLVAGLETEAAESSDVIAANVAADGSVTLFVE